MPQYANMKVSTFAIVLLCATSTRSFEYTPTKAQEKCPYKDTVDLSDYKALENGSYIYQNVVVDDMAQYNYRLAAYNETKEAEPHLRGCVCGHPKKCIKLCCEWGAFFNETSFFCERISKDLNIPIEMEIVFGDSVKKILDIFEKFIYQVGKPCLYPESLTMEEDKWNLLENGLLHIHNDDSYHDTVSYCLTPYQYNGTVKNVLVPMSCAKRNEITTSLAFHSYAALVTVLFLIPTVFVYLWLKELRENMRGKLLICYLFSLIISYSILSYINISEQVFDEKMCSFLGFTCYFFFIAAFLWLSVLCFDIWINFKTHRVASSNAKNALRFICYSCYAWGMASFLTFLAMLCQWSDKISEDYKPGIGEDVCWLDTNKWSAAIYFYWPNLIILLFSIATFTHMTWRIYRVRSDVARLTQKDNFFQENVLVILRIFLILGISWILDILSYFLRNFQAWDFLSLLSDFRSALQGVLIFILFVLKRNVLDSLKKSFSTTRQSVSRRSMFARFSKSSATSGPQTEYEVVELSPLS
ncbi:G-protein coupled receptor Mth2-like [Stomoxys calcitrans]|uniref:G-protein coupled receptors family 2 profile 2 domain-containing protein n=1 Tax=Stomoxys calcitrans TaxID=35570 RepID=A0A1I8Q8Z0_STOCA|nr:G-protein coupled receptor Mth2-like [Stomoxys calcitrans]